MKMLAATLAAAFLAATAGAAFAGGGDGCPFDSKRTTAETVLPAPEGKSAGS